MKFPDTSDVALEKTPVQEFSKKSIDSITSYHIVTVFFLILNF